MQIMDNRNTFTQLYYLKKHRVDYNGETPIYLRITINKKKTEMSMNRSIKVEDWNPSAGIVMGNSKIAKDINAYLFSTKSIIYEHYKYLREGENLVTPQAVKNMYLGIEESKGKKTLELYREHNEKIKLLLNIDYSPATVQRYETSYRFTEQFIKSKYKSDDLYLTELNHEFMENYEVFFKTVRKCSHNTTIKYLKNFKKIVLLAVANGDLERDPFNNFKMKLKKVDRGFLTDDELDILINKKFNVSRLEQIRDCFIFSCFTGLAHSDLKRLTKENIVTGTDGGKWIKIKRKKTDILSTIPILSVTQQLLDKYENHGDCILNNVLLPVKSNQKMNAYLKEIADLCELDKNLSSHLARHTFATTVTLNNDVPIETVSKMLGHSSIEMTKVYARLLDKKVGRDMKHLNEKFNITI